MLAIVPCEPTTNTMTHAKISTMIVRMAVATVESVLRMPHFARTDVRPANSAEPTAYSNHIQIASFSTIVRSLPVLCNRLLCKSRFYAKAAPRSLRGVPCSPADGKAPTVCRPPCWPGSQCRRPRAGHPPAAYQQQVFISRQRSGSQSRIDEMSVQRSASAV